MKKDSGTSEVIKKTGINKDLLFYLERAGFVSPRKEAVGKIDRRWWSKEEVEKISSIYEYTLDGFTPKEAAKRAINDLEIITNLKKGNRSEFIIKLEELKNVLNTNPKLELSAQGSLELKDINILNSLIETIKLILTDKPPKRNIEMKLGVSNFDIFFSQIKKSNMLPFTRRSIEKICGKMGIIIKEMEYPDNLFGISGKIPSGYYYIFVNNKFGKQKSYILTHELLHIFSEEMNKTKEFILKLIDANLSILRSG